MKELHIDEFKNYSFLSSLNEEGKYASYVESKVDEPTNGYKKRLHVFSKENNEEVYTTEFTTKGFNYIFDDNELLITSGGKECAVSTVLKKVNFLTGYEKVLAELPIGIGSIKSVNDDYYVVSATIDVKHPDYFKQSLEERLAIDKEIKDDNDYLIFDEYPFMFNGAGIINGNRNTLYLVNKNTFEIEKIIPSTIDVESFDVEDNKIVFSGVDFKTFKGKTSFVYEYDVTNKTFKTIYDGIMQIYRVFYLDKEVIVLGTFFKEYGAMEAGKFYTLKDNNMELLYDQEYSMHNSVSTDCHYGHGKSFSKKDNVAYFLTTKGYQGVLFSFDKKELKVVCEVNGSVDDYLVEDDGYYVIAMDDMKLQELYYISNGEKKQLTTYNEEVLKDVYVATPVHLVVDKPTKVDGWVLKPKNFDESKQYPAILDIHGGPKAAYGEVFFHEMQYWANEGYFVMFCNPRGSDGKGNEFADLRRNFGKIDYEDIMDFVDLVLAEYPNIDSNKVGVTGGSYGGYMTNWIIGHTDRFACAASQRSISNWITEVCATDYGIDFPIEQEFDDLYNCHDELWDMSPLKYATNATTPTLFIHSTEDYRCDFAEGVQMYTVLKCRGIDSKLVGFKGENHELSRSGKFTHRVRRLTEITNWMNNYLKGGAE